jgi:hypothetical protein
MNTKAFKTFIEKESDFNAPGIIERMLRDGWILLNIRIRRPTPDADGSFEDVAIYSLAHESEIMP